mgnify:CR=1 FL=1
MSNKSEITTRSPQTLRLALNLSLVTKLLGPEDLMQAGGRLQVSGHMEALAHILQQKLRSRASISTEIP